LLVGAAKVIHFTKETNTFQISSSHGKKCLTKTFLLMQKNIHVVPKDDKWAVERENSQRASYLAETQKEAIELARELAINSKVELLIHGKDGKIRERNSYGNDPYPPKG